MKKKYKNIPKIVGITTFIIVLFVILYFATQQSYLTIRTYDNPTLLPIQTGLFNLNGIEGEYETIRLGCYTAGSGYYINDLDEDLSFCNSISTQSNLLFLSSSNTISTSANGGTNYIKTKITLPAGKFKMSYDYTVKSYYGDNDNVVFNINGYTKTFKTPHWSVSQRGGSIQGNDVYEFETTKEEEVIFMIETTTVQSKENVIGNLKIEYTPNPIIIPPVEEGCSLLKPCNESYECKNKECTLIPIIPLEENNTNNNQTNQTVNPPIFEPITKRVIIVTIIAVSIIIITSIILVFVTRRKK
jgi:hypothetical protein